MKYLTSTERKSETANEQITLLTAMPSQAEIQTASKYAMDLTNAFHKSNITKTIMSHNEGFH